MARKVKINEIWKPLVISYGIGIALLTLVRFIAAWLGQNFFIYRPGRYDINHNPVLTQLTLYSMLQTAVIVCALAFLITNLSLYLNRSRLFVMILGFILFATISTNPLTASSNWATCFWLELIHTVFAAPIFFVIFKYVPKQNKI